MKTKYIIIIIISLMLSCFSAKADFANMNTRRKDDSRLVVNNYYNDYDFCFSSRINRYHYTYNYNNISNPGSRSVDTMRSVNPSSYESMPLISSSSSAKPSRR